LKKTLINGTAAYNHALEHLMLKFTYYLVNYKVNAFPIKFPMALFAEILKNIKIFTEPQKVSNSSSNLELAVQT
jgi:hypothetical protein